MDITFGPVPSRRLGHSLGINNIPPKHCSYSCIYCQVGKTPEQEIKLHPFYPPDEIHRQVAERLIAIRAQCESVDYLTFVPDGEPTLDSRLGETIAGLRDLGLPIAVITNATLLWRDEVRAALNRADWVSVKIDSLDPAVWQRINQPHPELELAHILEGIRTIAVTFKGTLTSETMLIEGVNDSEQAIEDLATFLTGAGIAQACLATPIRPPSVAGIRGPEQSVVIRARNILTAHGIDVILLTESEGEDFAYSGDLRRDILAITAVHPLPESTLRSMVNKAGEDMEIVQKLLDHGQLRRVEHDGNIFHIRPGAEPLA
jgi:wyosine [tRNA(Phe)-imidazoG37] synthetase (radical SAM superfamily)